ncbi:hypothetical protein BST61_g3894 [Cercospora zeina]
MQSISQSNLRPELQAVVVKGNELLTLLQGLSHSDIGTQRVQDCLAQLLTFRRTVRKRRSGPGSQSGNRTRERPAELYCVGLSTTGKRVLLAAVDWLASSSWDHLCQQPFFSSCPNSTESSPELALLSTYIKREAAGGTEARILALLVAHTIDDAIERGKLRTYGQLIEEWARSLCVKPSFVKDVEGLGRFCMGVLGFEGNGDQWVVDPAGLGALAMMPRRTDLKVLANCGWQFLEACKTIHGFDATARGLAPTVYSAIRGISEQKDFSIHISQESQLGRLLAAHCKEMPELCRKPHYQLPMRAIDPPLYPTEGMSIAAPSVPPEVQTRIVSNKVFAQISQENAAAPSPGEMEPQWRRNLQVDVGVRTDNRPYSLPWNLLVLLCHLHDVGVPVQLLHRGFRDQARWDSTGQRSDLYPPYLATKHHYFRLCQHSDLEYCISSLVTGNLVEINGGILLVPETIRTETLDSLSAADKAWWNEIAVAVVCHAFPRGKTLDAEYRSIGNILMPLVLRFCSCRDSSNLSELLAVLLSAAPLTKFAVLDSDIDDLKDRLPFGPVVVQAIRRKFRKRDTTDALKLLFENTVHQAETYAGHDKIRLNAQVGNLRAAYAQYLCNYGSPKDARLVLAPWSPRNVEHPSELEQLTAERIGLAQGKIEMNSANYDGAREKLAPLYKSTILQEEGFRTEVVCAFSVVSPDSACFDTMPKHVLPDLHLGALRALQAADVSFQERNFQQALLKYTQASDMPCSHTQEVRAIIGIAKTKHVLQETDVKQSWIKAHERMEELGWSKGFAWGLVDLSLAHLSAIRLETYSTAQSISEALEVLKREDHAM